MLEVSKIVASPLPSLSHQPINFSWIFALNVLLCNCSAELSLGGFQRSVKISFSEASHTYALSLSLGKLTTVSCNSRQYTVLSVPDTCKQAGIRAKKLTRVHLPRIKARQGKRSLGQQEMQKQGKQNGSTN